MSEKPNKKRRNGQGRKKGNRKKQKVTDVYEDDSVYYEAENVVDARMLDNGQWEYRVRWKGYAASDDTWEPAENMNPALLMVAEDIKRRKLGKHTNESSASQEKEESKESDVFKDSEDEESDEEMLLGIKDDEDSIIEEVNDSNDHWEWTDRELVKFRDIERIDVNDADARRRVTEARENGVPVCLIGHKGWANFAKRWLKKRTEAKPKVATQSKVCKELGIKVTENNLDNRSILQTRTPEFVNLNKSTLEGDKKMATSNSASAAGGLATGEEAPNHANGTEKLSMALNSADSPDHVINLEQETSPALMSTETKKEEWLDLAENWEVDVDKMSEDIGDEVVPVVRPKYNEQEPIHATVPLWKFLKKCWPSDGEANSSQLKPKHRQYLHQWQFPLSDTARPKLCGPDAHNPLPNDIFGEDLLDFWQDNGHGNPYEYIFMGRDQTMSKMHRDPGGLAISIAPIVGNKEVVLVHRSDGYSCMSHLQASLEKINLHKYPLLPQARIYKSVIKPGEILLMPQGTFHQCRNLTPCLSYSRFHLDTVNLRAFFESCVNGDAPEISHENVIWNASRELSDHLDKYVDELRGNKTTEVEIPPSMIRKVESMRALRGISRAIALRFENGGGGALWRPEAAGFEDELLSAEEEAKRWNVLVNDIDGSLHYFQYRKRNKKQLPPFRSRYYRPVQRLKPPIEKALEELPLVSDQAPMLDNTDLIAGTEVEVKYRGRRVKGVVKTVESALQAAFLHFDDLPDVFDEYIPASILKVPVAGEAFVDGDPEKIKPGTVVVYSYGTQEYRALVKFCAQDTFVLLKLAIGSEEYERWLPRSSVLALAGTPPIAKSVS